MEEMSEERAHTVVRKLVANLDHGRRERLLAWASELRAIRESHSSPLDKAKRALSVTLDREILAHLAGVLGDAIVDGSSRAKRLVWDERGWPARLGLAGVIAALSMGGAEAGAGIAALGGAIGVPLWLVLGAGGTLLGTLIDELEQGQKQGAGE